MATETFCVAFCSDIDRIEYDVTRLKYLTYKMASVRVCACVRACAVEIKPGMLRAACFDDIRIWTFHSKKGLFNTVFTREVNKVVEYLLLFLSVVCLINLNNVLGYNILPAGVLEESN